MDTDKLLRIMPCGRLTVQVGAWVAYCSGGGSSSDRPRFCDCFSISGASATTPPDLDAAGADGRECAAAELPVAGSAAAGRLVTAAGCGGAAAVGLMPLDAGGRDSECRTAAFPKAGAWCAGKHNHFGQFCGQRGGVPKACICQVRQSHCSSQHGMLQISASQQLSTCSFVCALCLPRRSKIRLIAAHACIRFYLSYCNYWQVSGREFFGTRLCAFHARHVLLEGPQNSVLLFNHSLGTCTLLNTQTDHPVASMPLSHCASLKGRLHLSCQKGHRCRSVAWHRRPLAQHLQVGRPCALRCLG